MKHSVMQRGEMTRNGNNAIGDEVKLLATSPGVGDLDYDASHGNVVCEPNPRTATRRSFAPRRAAGAGPAITNFLGACDGSETGATPWHQAEGVPQEAEEAAATNRAAKGEATNFLEAATAGRFMRRVPCDREPYGTPLRAACPRRHRREGDAVLAMSSGRPPHMGRRSPLPRTEHGARHRGGSARHPRQSQCAGLTGGPRRTPAPPTDSSRHPTTAQ